MGASQHTPGPWAVVDRLKWSANGAQIWAGDLHVASVSGKLDKAPHQKAADAQLIAAAPRLLEACRVAAKAELYDPATGIIDADVLEIIQDVARAAIAEAEAVQ